MTPAQRAHFKEIIEAQVAELSEEIETIKAAIYPDKGEGTSDKVAHISFKQEQNVHFQRHAEATKRLNRLKQAYLKVDTAEYGVCHECEEAIPLARLELMPESLYCVACMNEMGG